MVKPFSALPSEMNKLANKMTKGTSRVMRRAVLSIQAQLVESTPVDTGKARSNWVTTIGKPFLGVIPPYAPGRRLGRGEAANRAAANAQAASAASRFNAKKHSRMFIANSTPYIGILNSPQTRSVQSRPLFVQRAVRVGAASVAGARLIAG